MGALKIPYQQKEGLGKIIPLKNSVYCFPFGMMLPNRNETQGTDGYRYGFQGQEMDDEVKGEGNSVNYKYRMHDPRVGRFFAVDPLEKEYPHYSPYVFSGNRLLDAKEREGLEPDLIKWSSNMWKVMKTWILQKDISSELGSDRGTRLGIPKTNGSSPQTFPVTVTANRIFTLSHDNLAKPDRVTIRDIDGNVLAQTEYTIDKNITQVNTPSVNGNIFVTFDTKDQPSHWRAKAYMGEQVKFIQTDYKLFGILRYKRVIEMKSPEQLQKEIVRISNGTNKGRTLPAANNSVVGPIEERYFSKRYKGKEKRREERRARKFKRKNS